MLGCAGYLFPAKKIESAPTPFNHLNNETPSSIASMAKIEEAKGGRTVVFLHPDLGIGGAERLIVDAAVGLQNRGHKVVVFTSHCDPKHCFDEARDGRDSNPPFSFSL